MFYWVSLVTLLVVGVQSIPTNKSIEGLQSGTFAFHAINNAQTHLFMWQFQTSFAIAPQLAFAISGLSIINAPETSAFDLLPQAVTSTGVIVSWKRSLNRWLLININFMASIRDDLSLGYQTIKMSNTSSTSYDLMLKRPLSNPNITIARLFIIGCCAGSQLFDCGIVGKKLTATTLTVAAYSNQNGQRQATQDIFFSFSYIIFAPAKAGFSSYGGMSDEDKFIGQSSQSIRKVIYKTDNLLYGFSMLTFRADEAEKINADIDADLLLTVSAINAVKYRFLYIIIGKSSKQTCTTSQFPYQWLDQCVSQCPNNTYTFQYANGGFSCLQCSKKLNEELINGSCVCKKGFKLEGNKCKTQKELLGNGFKNRSSEGNLLALYQKMRGQIGENDNVQEHLHANQSSKDREQLKNETSNYQFKTGLVSQEAKQFKQNQTDSQQELTRSSKTDAYQIAIDTVSSGKKETSFKQTQQISQSGKLDQNKEAAKNYCPAQPENIRQQFDYQSTVTKSPLEKGFTDSQILKTFQSNSPKVSQENKEEIKAASLPTFIDSSPSYSESECQTNSNQQVNSYNNCGLKAYKYQGKCFCRPGYNNINGNCVLAQCLQDSLPIYVNQFTNGQSCSHFYPFMTNSSRPQSPRYCVPPSFIGFSGQCECPHDYVMFKDKCIQCSYPALFDYIQGKCKHYCGKNSFYSQKDQKCICKYGYGKGLNGECVICKQGSFLAEGYCVLCPDRKVYDYQTKKCVCQAGTLLTSKGECVDRCGQNQHFDQTKKACVCDEGFGRMKNRCVFCDVNQKVNEDGICSLFCSSKEEIIDGKCRCKKGLISENKKCVQCESLNNTILLNGICIKCPEGERPVNGKCKQLKAIFTLEQKAKQLGNKMDKSISLDRPPVCGNGFVEGLQQCDDKNNISGDGCSSDCVAEKGFVCKRMPSRCANIDIKNTAISNTSTTVSNNSQNGSFQPTSLKNVNSQSANQTKNASRLPDIQQSNKNDSNSSQSSNLFLQKDIVSNSNQIYVTLNTKTAFNFTSQSEMQKFLKVTFTGCKPPTVFFSQHPAPSKQLFDCLMLFPSGVPTSSFTANFSYDYQGQKGFLSSLIDPLAANSINSVRNSMRMSRERV